MLASDLDAKKLGDEKGTSGARFFDQL
jgi:hypothetical protein